MCVHVCVHIFLYASMSTVSIHGCAHVFPCVCVYVCVCVCVCVCQTADSSDLGRPLSCWKHTAAHQIFTAPSNSGLHVVFLPLASGCWLQAAREERKTHQHPSPDSLHTHEKQRSPIMSSHMSFTGLMPWTQDQPLWLDEGQKMWFVLKKMGEVFCSHGANNYNYGY